MSERRYRDLVLRSARRMKESRTTIGKFWSGLALAGSVGWMIALPTVVGAWLGRLLDTQLSTGLSFTLGFLFFGLVAGIYSVWRFFLRGLV